MGFSNPFAVKKGHNDTNPAPGGMDGGIVEHSELTQYGDDLPHVPFLWGQGFSTIFGSNYSWQYPYQPLPLSTYQAVIPTIAPYNQADHIWPVIHGSDGAYQLQLNEHVPPINNGGETVAIAMQNNATALQQMGAAPLSNIAGGFARSE